RLDLLKKMVAAGAIGALTLGIFSGCGSSERDMQAAELSGEGAETDREAEVNQEAYQGEQDTSGGRTINFGIQNYGGGSIDPAAEINCAWNASRYGVGECLFRFDHTMNVVNWLCDEYTVNEEHTEWVFHVRDGVKFSDGCDLTAEAVKASFDRLYEAGASGSSAPQKFLEEEAEITADNTSGSVTIKTVTPYVDLTKNLAYPVMVILDTEHTTDYAHAAIGTGPYVATNFREEVGYTMVANEHYWGGEVPFQSIELMYMGDASAKAMALQSGQLDLAENVTNISDLRDLQADPGFTVTIASGVRTGLAHMNMSEGKLLSDKTLREAVLMALDDETMCSVTVGGLYTAGYSVLPSNLDYGYENLTDPDPYNPEAAKKLLDEAGIVDANGDGIRELDGRDVVLHYVTYDNRCLKDFAEAIQTQLAEIGIGVDLEIGDSARQWDSYQSGDFDLNGSNWTTVGTGDPAEYLAAWCSDSGADYCGYKNEEYDSLFHELTVTFDNDVRREIVQKMQQILLDDAAAVVHGYYNSSMVSRNETVGGAAISTADYYWITTDVYPVAGS
ncbi:MAG: ABC transporter substrate-binding protein, partial [Lachnospiraceae bacterium]|nr:ABC transporter substrate-binding protein [Lachnospiraceae bacterium]